jgi:hypothetical protein
VIGEGLSKHFAVRGKRIRVGIVQLLQQLRRALDVGEEEGDRAGREVTHAA